ncbi:RNA polymerase subunit sigma-24 [Intrasporangium oryzae NRRL B-24470]|uniref:RNA polymerase subunit sigma-24 n=1 Tax=Intrasporangium oryzae NRRL B-24470 TaxID=1386089 RepID=W9G7Z8_9MICO|nr:RNA polymerase subunit sigma-24 [Intrasporangium oryzae NRRL B-24470]
MTVPNEVEDLLRELAPQVLGTLSRRYGDFDTAEDAVQEALIAASTAWPRDGVPANPRGWLLQTASRRLIDHWRSDRARQRREAAVALQEPRLGEAPEPAPDEDDTLPVLFMCCHPALTPASAIALTLRAVGGLTTAEIASAFLVPEATMAQRISRAKQRIAASGGRFRMPTEEEYAARRASVLHVLYLVFNEGYAASSGSRVEPGELAAEAIRLTRLVHRALPEDTEVMGLLALMLLLDARRPARTGPSGALVSLADQDRTLWDGSRITEGLALLDRAVAVGAVGEYQLQAAIAAVHDRASQADETDWPEIRALYGLLERMTGSPVVTLNRAVAAAMAEGPEVGLAVLDEVGDRLAGNHRLDAVRAHLLELAGDSEAARSHYRAAAARTTSRPERDYLTARAARVGS